MTNNIYDMLAEVVEDRRAEWRTRAACLGVGTKDFFPNRTGAGIGSSRGRALRYCDRCPVSEECLDYIREHPYYNRTGGIWGGVTWSQRKSLRLVAAGEVR